jgi:hypothetical protein
LLCSSSTISCVRNARVVDVRTIIVPGSRRNFSVSKIV